MTNKSDINKQCKQAVIFTVCRSPRGFSIDEQVTTLKNYCTKKGLSITKTYSFVAGTTKYSRKYISEILYFVRKQKHKTAIIVHSVDKLQRNFNDSAKLSELLEKDKIEIHFFRENLIIHKNSSSEDILRWKMFVSSAQKMVEAMRANVMRSQLYNWAQRKWPLVAPIGYINTRDSNNKATIIVDEERAPIIKKMFEEYATGRYSIKSLTELAKKLNLCAKQGRTNIPISQTCVNNLLKKPFYIGKMLVKGQLIPHIYPPIIDKALFDKVQAQLMSKNS